MPCDMLDADKDPQFWLLLKNDYPSLSDKVMKVLLPFVTTYMCETEFPAAAAAAAVMK